MGEYVVSQTELVSLSLILSSTVVDICSIVELAVEYFKLKILGIQMTAWGTFSSSSIEEKESRQCSIRSSPKAGLHPFSSVLFDALIAGKGADPS